MHPAFEKQSITTDELTLHFRLRPARRRPGRALLLLHGWPGISEDYADVADQLAGSERYDAYSIVVPDLRGFGETGAPADDDCSPQAHLRDLAAIRRRLGDGETIVVGYDLGANLAQQMARSDMYGVRGLVLMDPVHPAARAAAATMNLVAETWYQVLNVQPWAGDLIAMNRKTVEIYLRHFYSHWWGDGAIDETRFQEVVDRYSEPGAFDASLGWYRSRHSARATEAQDALTAATIDLPTEVIWGERDPVTPVVFAESLGKSFSTFNLVRLPSVGHFAPREAPGEVVAALDRLLGRLRH